MVIIPGLGLEWLLFPGWDWNGYYFRAGTGIIISGLGLEWLLFPGWDWNYYFRAGTGMVIISIPAPLFFQFQPCLLMPPTLWDGVFSLRHYHNYFLPIHKMLQSYK